MRLAVIKRWIVDQNYTPEELLALLEIDVEDLLDNFPDRVRECSYKFGIEENYDDEDR